MSATPYINFFVKDWLGDGNLRGCSVAARGLWMDLLCYMRQSDRPGYFCRNGKPFPSAAAAQMCGVSEESYLSLVQELTEAGVPSFEGEVMYSRRMVKDEQKRLKCTEAGAKGGNPKLTKKEASRPLTPPLTGTVKPSLVLDNGIGNGNSEGVQGEVLTLKEKTEAIYQLYPRKVSRADALKAIEKALKVKEYPFLIEAVKAYADAVALWPESEKQFIPHPATWFNGQRYDDDRSTWKAKGTSNGLRPQQDNPAAVRSDATARALAAQQQRAISYRPEDRGTPNYRGPLQAGDEVPI